MKNKFANTKKDLFSYRWKLHGVIKCHAEIIIKAYIYSNLYSLYTSNQGSFKDDATFITA